MVDISCRNIIDKKCFEKFFFTWKNTLLSPLNQMLKNNELEKLFNAIKVSAF